MSVKLLIPGRPTPMYRPRQGKTKQGRTIWYIPQTTKNWQQLVRTAALQRKDEIEALKDADPAGRIFIKLHLVYNRNNRGDPNNVMSNFFDGLVLALGGSDKNFEGSVTFDVNSGLEEGYTEAEILPHGRAGEEI